MFSLHVQCLSLEASSFVNMAAYTFQFVNNSGGLWQLETSLLGKQCLFNSFNREFTSSYWGILEGNAMPYKTSAQGERTLLIAFSDILSVCVCGGDFIDENSLKAGLVRYIG